MNNVHPYRFAPAESCPVTSLIHIDNPEFIMGTDSQDGFSQDGEGPRRRVRCDSFRIAPCTVSNAQFQNFIEATGYATDAERCGWSFVFHLFVTNELKQQPQGVSSAIPWWLPVKGAYWAQPEGPGSTIQDRLDHPVTHVSWFDAQAYC